jgi:AraC-like DNA-binding protein
MENSILSATHGPAPTDRHVLDCLDFDDGDRFDAWTDAVNQSFVPLHSAMKASTTSASFQGKLVAQSLGRAQISTVRGSAVSVQRTTRAISQSDPGYIKLGLQLRGYSVISQDDRDAALAPGDFAIYDTTRPYTLDFEDTFAMFVVMFPLETLRINRRALSTLTASRFSGRRGLGAITSSFLGELSKQLDAEPMSGGFSLCDAVIDLVVTTLFERLGAQAVTDDASRRRSLLLQVRAYIGSRLDDPHLSVASIANAHHVSVRYLQKLFEEQDDTVGGHIRHSRLDQCRRDLSNPALLGRSVAAIGSDWGFTDAGGFSRAFRREFAISPTDYRSATRSIESRRSEN